MAAAMQLSAVTSYLTANIAAIPLLWMLPLGIYLLTFILAFEFPTLYPRRIIGRLLVVMLASVGYAMSKIDASFSIGLAVLFFLTEFLLAGMLCHAEAYRRRPQRSDQMTLFYLMIAAGGAMGTFLIGVVSPLVFDANYDLAISFVVTAVLAAVVTWKDGWAQRLLWLTASVLLLIFVVMLRGLYGSGAILQARNFYGSLRVTQMTLPQGGAARMLVNGTIQHGTQLFAPGLSRTPTTYYADDSGIGLALRYCCEDRPRTIGVVGLGAGTIAAYGRTADRIRFYEINPLVRPIARNYFTYLRDSAARITFAEGDARTSLLNEAAQNFDVLAVDAFSGDAIPLHLLTVEAMAIYRRHLAPNGILAFHISNRYLDLAPEIALLAQEAHMQARIVKSPLDVSRGAYRSTWVLLTTSAGFLKRPQIAGASSIVAAKPGLQVWTDDYSSILPILRLWHH
jgi:hypothetical protein